MTEARDKLTPAAAIAMVAEIHAAIVEACCFYGAADATLIADRAMEAIRRIGDENGRT